MCNDIEVEAAVIVELEEINVDLLVDLGIVEINVWSVIVKAYLLTLNFYNKHNRDPNELNQWSNMLYNFQLEHMQCW